MHHYISPRSDTHYCHTRCVIIECCCEALDAFAYETLPNIADLCGHYNTVCPIFFVAAFSSFEGWYIRSLIVIAFSVLKHSVLTQIKLQKWSKSNVSLFSLLMG